MADSEKFWQLGQAHGCSRSKQAVLCPLNESKRLDMVEMLHV